MKCNNARLTAPSRVAFCLIAIALSSLTIAQAQPTISPADVRELNGEVVKLHGEAKRVKPPEIATVRAKANAILQTRASAFQQLIKENPKEALSLAFSSDLLSELSKVFPDSVSQLEEHGSWKGPAEYVVLDAPDLKHSESVVRITSGREKLTVSFAGPAPKGLKCGSVLKVDGVRMKASVAALGGTATTTVAAASTACSPTGPQSVAVLLVTFPGVPAPNITRESVYDIFFSTTGKSLDGFWREASYGRTSAAGNVFGWFTLDRSYDCLSDYMGLADAAIRAADSQVDFRQYGRVVIVFPDTGSCGWAGLGTIGCLDLSSAGGI